MGMLQFMLPCIYDFTVPIQFHYHTGTHTNN